MFYYLVTKVNNSESSYTNAPSRHCICSLYDGRLTSREKLSKQSSSKVKESVKSGVEHPDSRLKSFNRDFERLRQ